MLWGPRFRDLAREVLESKRLRAPNTYAAAELRLFRLGEFFGGYRLSAVTESSWREYIAFRQRERPSTKFADDRKYLRQVLGLALRKGLVKSIIPLPVPDIPSDVGREVTDEEIKRLYAVSRDELRFQIEIAVKMGLRLREMLSLRWDRIEWASRLVRLRPEDTKTRRGRIIPMNSDLFPQFESRFRIAKTPFVFPRVTDPTRPMHDNKKQWQAAKRRAGVKARWHDLRHSAATVAIRRGVPLATVSRLLGMSEGMLLKIYHHVNVDDLRRGADAMRDRK